MTVPARTGRQASRGLRGLAGVVLRRRGWFFAVCLTVLVLVVAWRSLQPKVYRTAAVVSIRTAAATAPQGQPDSLLDGLVQAPLGTLRGETGSPRFLTRVIEGAPELQARLEKGANRDLALERLSRGVRVEPRGEGRFEIAFEHSSAAVARDAANRITAEFSEEVFARLRSRFEQRLEPLKQQQRELEAALKEKEEQVAAFRSWNAGLLVPEEAVLQQIAGQEAGQREQAGQIEAEQRQLESLRARLAETPETIESERSTEHDPQYNLIRSELSVLEVRRDRLLDRYTEKHPEVKVVLEQIEEHRQQLAVLDGGVTTDVVESINPLYQLLQQREAEGEIRLEQLRDELESGRQALAELRVRGEMVAQRGVEYRELTQDLDGLKQNYESVNSQVSALESDWERSSKQEPVQVGAWAPLPTRPLRAGLASVAGFGLGLGVILGLLAALAREYFDRSLRSVEQAQAALSLPILGAIPSFELEGE